MKIIQTLILLFTKLLKAYFFLKLRTKFLWSGWKYRVLHPNGKLKFLSGTEQKLQENAQNEQIALFVVYAPKYPEMYRQYFKLLDKIGFKVITVINGSASEEFMDFFSKHSLCVLTRENFGRDFGAYKEFIQYLANKNIQPKRLLVCNDSVFANMLPEDNRFSDFIHSTADRDLVGVAEYMGRPNYHIQSYFLIFSNKVLNGKNFINFWSDFLITDDRRLNIHNGEVALTQAILKDHISPTIFLSTDKLLESISLNDTSSLDILEDLKHNQHVLPGKVAKLYALKDKYNALKIEQLELNDQKTVTAAAQEIISITEQAKQDIEYDFKSELATLINYLGIITTATFGIVRLFGFPFLKRDVVYRQVSEWMLIRRRSAGFNEKLLEEYIDDQRLKKRHWNLKRGEEKIAYDIGMN